VNKVSNIEAKKLLETLMSGDSLDMKLLDTIPYFKGLETRAKLQSHSGKEFALRLRNEAIYRMLIFRRARLSSKSTEDLSGVTNDLYRELESIFGSDATITYRLTEAVRATYPDISGIEAAIRKIDGWKGSEQSQIQPQGGISRESCQAGAK
jgi:hypothetical protein